MHGTLGRYLKCDWISISLLSWYSTLALAS